MSKKRRYSEVSTTPDSESHGSDESSTSTSQSYSSQHGSLQLSGSISETSQRDSFQSNGSLSETSRSHSLQTGGSIVETSQRDPLQPGGSLSGSSLSSSSLSESSLSDSSWSSSSLSDSSQTPEIDSTPSDWWPLDLSASEAAVRGVSQPKRRPIVPDAVAARVTQAGNVQKLSSKKTSKGILRPAEVLFKKVGARNRHADTNHYNARANLPADQSLPNGDLLSAIRAYISKFHSETDLPGDVEDGDFVNEETELSEGADEKQSADKAGWECMDETALIALGILMEETARSVMGETGDLAFTEDAEDEADDQAAEEEGGEEEKEQEEDDEDDDGDDDEWVEEDEVMED